MNHDNLNRHQFLHVPCLPVIILLLLFQCTGGSGRKKEKTKTPVFDSLQTVQLQLNKSDSLKDILKTPLPDTARLGILDAIINIEPDVSIKSEYNDQLEELAQKILAANPPDEIKNSCKKYLGNVFYRRGEMYTEQDDFSRALDGFNKSLKFREETGDTSGMLNSLINMGNTYYYMSDIKKALECFQRSLTISEHTGDKNSMSRSLNNIGIMYSELDDIPAAIVYYNKNLKVQEELGDKNSIANTLNNIGLTYSYQGDMANALEYYTRCLKLKEELGDKQGISVALSNIGIIYDYEKDFTKALDYYHRSLKIQEELGDKEIISATLTNIGNVYAEQSGIHAMLDSIKSDSLIKKSLEFYYRSLRLSEETGDKYNLIETLINIGQTYHEMAQSIMRQDKIKSDSLYTRSLECLNRSLRLSEEIGDKSSISFALVDIAEIYLERNEISKALTYARKGYRMAKEAGYTFNIKDATELLDKIYLKLGNYKLSRQYYGEYVTMNDSIVREDIQRLVQKNYFQYQYEKKAATDSIAHSKEMEIANLEIERQKAESRRQKLIIGFVAIGLLFVLLIAAYIFRTLRITRKQKNTIEKQKEHIEYIHEALTDSIHYAERIQKAVLPSVDYIREVIADSGLQPENYFILYKPRDIVSGDFYFFRKRDQLLFIAAADCTGHGVPGAFMSMLGMSFLNQIITQENIQTASQVLDELRNNIIHSLQQKGITGEQKDGMDISFVLYDMETKIMQFSGAYSPLYLIPNNTKELTVIKPDRMPVAISEDMQPFTNHIIQLHKGDIIYLASDGYEDQFGGPKGKKFYSKYLRQLFTEICDKPMNEQKEILDKTIEDWKNSNGQEYEQTDDITVMGIKIL